MKLKAISVILCLLALAIPALAQQEVYPFQTPAYTTVLGYGANGVSYICYARSTVSATGTTVVPSSSPSPSRNNAVSISAATNANPVVFTSTGHGMIVGSQPSVIISGGTGSWAAVNSTKAVVATVIDANTFSVAIDSSGFGAVTGTLSFKTTSPRTTVAEWAVVKYLYDGSGNLTSQIWLGGHNQPLDQKCSDASSATVNVQ